MKIRFLVISSVIASSFLCATTALAWHDATHMAVAKAAGLGNYAYMAVGPDIAKEKAGDLEGKNHYNNTPKGTEVTAKMVVDQVKDYNSPDDTDGHLYGAIVASIRDFIVMGAGSKYALYPLGYASHYIGDLSMPFHNIAFDPFNAANHSANDGIVESSGPANETTAEKVDRIAGEIEKRMSKLPPIVLSTDVKSFYKDLSIQISAVANRAAALGYAMRDADPPRTRLTEDEAYAQLAQSARLLKGVRIATMK
jgi:hypothetical protein